MAAECDEGTKITASHSHFTNTIHTTEVQRLKYIKRKNYPQVVYYSGLQEK
jgi:hypothetical protein